MIHTAAVAVVVGECQNIQRAILCSAYAATVEVGTAVKAKKAEFKSSLFAI